MATRTTLWLLCLLFTTSLRAEPINLLVGDITFHRPEKWRWEPPSNKSTAETRYVVPDYFGGQDSIDVRFYVERPNEGHTRESWLANFINRPSENGMREEQKRIGSRTITYLHLRGTYDPPGGKPKAGHRLLAATINYGNLVIRARVLGPAGQVENAAADFVGMVEAAVLEREIE